jgi:hypothetical protein
MGHVSWCRGGVVRRVRRRHPRTGAAGAARRRARAGPRPRRRVLAPRHRRPRPAEPRPSHGEGAHRHAQGQDRRMPVNTSPIRYRPSMATDDDRSACETDLAECATWILFGSSSSSTLMIRSRLVDGGPRPWAGLLWATPRTSSRSGRLRIGCRAYCSCRFRRRRLARTDFIRTSVLSIKPQKSNVSFPSVLGGPMSGSVTRRGWYWPIRKAMSSASLVDGFGPILRSRRRRTTLRLSAGTVSCGEPRSCSVLAPPERQVRTLRGRAPRVRWRGACQARGRR